MSTVIALVNQKGGVGKTTTAVNLGAALAIMKKEVLLIDFDPQGNLSSGLGLKQANHPGVYQAISGHSPTDQLILPTQLQHLHLLPSDLELSGLEIELADAENREAYLQECLLSVRNTYDYLLVDCPPMLGLLTVNALIAADQVLIPLQCEFYALEGLLTMLINTITRIQQRGNPHLTINGILFTMFDSRTKLSQEVVEQMADSLGKHRNLLYQTVIPRNVRLAEAPSHGQPISLYSPSCTGALAYSRLAREVVERG